MVGGQTSWLARMFGLCQDDTPDVGKKANLTTSTKDTSPMFIPKVAIC